MQIWFTFHLNIIILLPTVISKSVFNHHIKAYEIVDCYLIPNNKPSVFVQLLKEQGMKYEFDLEIHFRAFNKSFQLLLQEDLQFQALEIVSRDSNGTSKQITSKSRFFDGVLIDNFQNSAVTGYLTDDVFTGTIRYDRTIFIIEPANLFFPAKNYTKQIIVYLSDEIVEYDDYRQYSPIPKETTHYEWYRIYENYQNRYGTSSKGFHRMENSNTDYACHVEMVADHTLYYYFQQNINSLSAFLYLHGKYADFIFRRTDFDDDGKPDNIRIVVKKVHIYKHKKDPGYLMARASSLSEFLDLFALRRSEFCLSFSLCSRSYSSVAVGLAFRPVVGSGYSPGGICQRPELIHGKIRYLNTGVVTTRNAKKQTIPLITTLLAVTHEMGHLFGSDHDPLTDLYCTPGGERGYYLMYPKTNKDFKPLNSQFSPCSRKEIDTIIKYKGGCLKVPEAVCGNGVREGEEECDCGVEETCKNLDSCCTPSDAESPEEGCKFRTNQGAYCSPKESKCCSKECTVIKDKDTVCYKSDTKCFISFCNGENATCPEPVLAEDKFPCERNSMTCNRGFCNSSVCLDHNLRNCKCKEHNSVCYVCCLKDTECIPAYDLGLRTHSGSFFVVSAGTSCDSGRYQCDGAGNCVLPKSHSDESEGRSVTWWAIVILSVVFLTLSLIFLYLLRKQLTS